MRNFAPAAHRATFRAVAAFAVSAAACLAPAAAWSQNSDLSVVKTAPATVNAGTDLTYTITFRNHGPNDAPNAILLDAVPAGTTFVSATTQPGFACSLPAVGGTGTITCSQALMVNGATANFTMTVHIGPSVPVGSVIGNLVQVGSANSDPAPGDEQSTAFSTVTGSADLFISKNGPPTVIPGQNATYTIQFSNNGTSDAQSVVLNDPIPAGTTFVSENQDFGPGFTCTTPAVGGTGAVNCTIGTLAPGQFGQFTVVVKVNTSVADGTVVSNTTTITSATSDPDTSSNSANSSALATAFADLQVTKSAPPTVAAGQNLSFSLSVVNAGPSDAQFVSLTDPLPAGTTYVSASQDSGPGFACSAPPVGGTGNFSCGILTLPALASATFTLTVAVDPALASGSTVGNGFNAGSATTDPVPASNVAFSATTVQTFADVGVTKTGPATADAGSDITYTIAAGNAGPSDAPGFAMIDGTPPGTTFVSGSQTAGPPFSCSFPAVGGTGVMGCSIATLPPGQFGVFSFVVHVPSSVPAGSLVGNAANVGSAATDPNPGDNLSTVATTVTVSADVGVSKSGPATINAGTNITYNLTVSNAGPSDAQGVSMSDVLPANTTFVSYTQNTGPSFSLTTPAVGGTGTVTSTLATLPAGGSATFTLVLAVAASAPGGSSLANTATVSSVTPDANAGNNSSTSTATVLASADLQVTKSGPASITAGTNITYTLGVTNAGTSDAQAVSLSDALPANTTFVSLAQNTGPSFTLSTPAVGGTGTATATLATLPAGGSATFTLVLAVAASAPNASSIANTATVSSTTTDPTPGNNSATSTASVVANADVQVTKTGPATINAGSNITYTLTVNNTGPSDAQAVSLSDTLPANTTFVSLAQNSGPTFTLTTPAAGATGTATATLATLASGASATFTLVLNVNSSTANGGSIANTATVSSTTTDPTPGNNSATATASVTTSADLQVTKTGPASMPTSSLLTYNLALLNAGPSDALTVVFSDTLPAGTTFVSWAQNSGPAFTCTTPAAGGTGTVSCTIASLTANAGGMFTLVLQALPSVLGGSVITNTATATTATSDPNAANNSASAATNITAITTFSGPSATGSGTVTASFTGGGPACAFGTARLIPVSGDPASPKKPLSTVEFPHGLFTFTTTNCIPGSTLTFTITYPTSVERMTYWKFGPEPGAPTPHWYILPATFLGQTATFSITDGQLGDDDLLANGTIVDQGGPGIGSTAVPTLSEWMQLLLAAMLLAMGIAAMRRHLRA